VKLLLQDDYNVMTQLRDIQTVSPESKVLIFFINYAIRPDNLKTLEDSLSEKTGMKCIVLDSRFEKVLGV